MVHTPYDHRCADCYFRVAETVSKDGHFLRANVTIDWLNVFQKH